jgi:hypothetical protein
VTTSIADALTSRFGPFAARLALIELRAALHDRALDDADPETQQALHDGARRGLLVAYKLAAEPVPPAPVLDQQARALLHHVEREWRTAVPAQGAH